VIPELPLTEVFDNSWQLTLPREKRQEGPEGGRNHQEAGERRGDGVQVGWLETTSSEWGGANFCAESIMEPLAPSLGKLRLGALIVMSTALRG